MIDVIVTKGWNDYELLDSGNGRRLEKFGQYVLDRPDPQAIWLPKSTKNEWEKADATFVKIGEKEQWVSRTKIPEKWLMQYNDISFYAKLSPFKHTGVFPEQAGQWDYLTSQITNAKSQKREIKVLNLFAYTGIASLVAAKAGAQVTHVDASSAAIKWARENQEVAHLTDKPIRWILDDTVKFVEREVRRGNTYEVILLDPPIYGHGPNREVWDFMKDFPMLLSLSAKLLSPSPLLLTVNAYAISASSTMLQNVLADYLPHGVIHYGELALAEKEHERVLSTGIFATWTPR